MAGLFGQLQRPTAGRLQTPPRYSPSFTSSGSRGRLVVTNVFTGKRVQLQVTACALGGAGCLLALAGQPLRAHWQH
jgi:hypothetical protein